MLGLALGLAEDELGSDRPIGRGVTCSTRIRRALIVCGGSR